MNAELHAFPAFLLQALPEFDADGFLPPGDYGPSATDFEARFAISIPAALKSTPDGSSIARR